MKSTKKFWVFKKLNCCIWNFRFVATLAIANKNYSSCDEDSGKTYENNQGYNFPIDFDIIIAFNLAYLFCLWEIFVGCNHILIESGTIKSIADFHRPFLHKIFK